jgi:hypothetical protein
VQVVFQNSLGAVNPRFHRGGATGQLRAPFRGGASPPGGGPP